MVNKLKVQVLVEGMENVEKSKVMKYTDNELELLLHKITPKCVKSTLFWVEDPERNGDSSY